MQVVGDALDVLSAIGRVANDLRSPPAQKNRPDPVSTTTFVALVSQRLAASASSRVMAWFMPFAASGRFSVIRAMEPDCSSVMVSYSVTPGLYLRTRAARFRQRPHRREVAGEIQRPQRAVGDDPWRFGRADAVVGAAVDHRLHQPEGQVIGVDGPAALGDHPPGQGSVAVAKFGTAQPEVLEPLRSQFRQQIQRPEIPPAGTQLR